MATKQHTQTDPDAESSSAFGGAETDVSAGPDVVDGEITHDQAEFTGDTTPGRGGAVNAERILAAVGTAAVWLGVRAARGGKWTAKRVADGYRAVDPDLRRHIAHAPIVGLTQVAPARTEIRRLPDDGYRPVLFVHGLAGHPGNFAPMRGYFRFMGRSRTYAIAFRGSERIPAMADDLRAAVEAIVVQNELPEGATIDIVAHSMGGLVSRYAMATSDLASRVETLVTLGTPHHGTYAARYAATAQTLDLRPNSEVLRLIEGQIPWSGPPAMPNLVALWSEADMLLLPPESAQMPGAENVEMAGYTHLSYLIQPSAWQRTWSLLDKARPR